MNWLHSQINIVIQLAIVSTMVSVGLQVTGAQILSAVMRRGLLAKALLANLVLIPLLAVLFTRLFALPQWTAVGILLVAAAPGAPMIPKLVEAAKADLPFSVGLMFILATLTIVVTPVTAGILLPVDVDVEFDVLAVIRMLLILQLIPLLTGLAVQQWLPALKHIIVRPSILLANLFVAMAIALVAIRDYETLIKLPWTAVAAILLLVASMLLAGWLLGGPQPDTRRSLALGTSAQSNGLALVITSSSFPGSGADIAVVAFGLLNILINFAIAFYWRRKPV
jgi:BASS family bile acid:Na+ symporter